MRVKNGLGHIKQSSSALGLYCHSVDRKFSEFHGVRFVVHGEAEAGMQVFLDIGLDILAHSSIDQLPGTLVPLSSLFTGEESIVDLGSIDTSEVHGGGGGDGVNLVDALKRNTVDLVGSGDQEEAGVKSLTELGGIVHLFAGVTSNLVGWIPLCLFDHWRDCKPKDRSALQAAAARNYQPRQFSLYSLLGILQSLFLVAISFTGYLASIH